MIIKPILKYQLCLNQSIYFKKNKNKLSCPVKNVNISTRLLELMDKDGNGKVRLPDVKATLAFALDHFNDLDTLMVRKTLFVYLFIYLLERSMQKNFNFLFRNFSFIYLFISLSN